MLSFACGARSFERRSSDYLIGKRTCCIRTASGIPGRGTVAHALRGRISSRGDSRFNASRIPALSNRLAA